MNTSFTFFSTLFCFFLLLLLFTRLPLSSFLVSLLRALLPVLSLENVTTRNTRASTVLRGEKEKMKMTERMGDGARDHECANERVPACERGKEKKGRRIDLSALSMLFSARYHRGRALERLFTNSN